LPEFPPTAKRLLWVSCNGWEEQNISAADGAEESRVRSEGDTARIELPPEQMGVCVNDSLQVLVSAFQSYGFIYVTLDLEGYRSGKLNQVLTQFSTSLKI